MISKERLEELIEQGATIYCPYFLCYDGVKLDKNTDRITNIGILISKHENTHDFFKFDNLFETKEEAEWYRDFGCIEKIERLWFPTWESVYNDLKDYKDGDFYILDNYYFSFVYNKRYETSQLFLYTHNEKYNWNANKENYYEACKLAKSLFLGEKR